MTSVIPVNGLLLGDIHLCLVESNVIFNVLSSIVWRLVVPSSILQLGAIDIEGIVGGITLPGAMGRQVSLSIVLLLDGGGWEVDVSLYDLVGVCLGDDDAVYFCSCVGHFGR